MTDTLSEDHFDASMPARKIWLVVAVVAFVLFGLVAGGPDLTPPDWMTDPNLAA